MAEPTALEAGVLLQPVPPNQRQPTSSSQQMSNTQIRVLTLNCWGLKYVAKDREARIHAIASELGQADYDIIGLQELWVLADYEVVRARVSNRLPYAKFFYSGALGAGLAIFSRYPITGALIHPYSLNGSPLDVSGGDWFVGKAAGCITFKHPLLGEVDVYNTHLYARGGEDGPEHNRAHRLVNAWEFSRLVRSSAEQGRYVIALGDFNSIPTTLPIKVIREHGGLADSWAQTHESAPSPNTPVSPEEAIEQFGVTADSPLNSYSAGKPLDASALRQQGKRLDYVFYRQPRGQPTLHLTCSSCQVVFTGLVPGRSFSFSDHFGFEAVLDIGAPPVGESATVKASGQLSDDSIARVSHALVSCYRTSKANSRFLLSLFVGCIFLLLIITVGSAWLPHSWINPMFILFTVFISWLGTTTFYAGFLFGNWERSALMTAIEDLEVLRAHRYGEGSEAALVAPTGAL